MSVSVVIVTHNRPNDCIEAVQSVLQQTYKPLDIIVIDDASTIPLAIPSGDFSNVRLVRCQKELGLAGARSLGSRLAMGSIVAFIDDDAIANRHWVQELVRTFKKGADVVGGTSIPIYFSKIPKWWDDQILGVFVGVRNDVLQVIFGCNFAARKEVLERLGYFDYRLGRVRGKQLSGEDTLFLLKAFQKNYKVYFNNKAIIYHKVRPKRLTIGYLIKRAWYGGASWKQMFGPDPRKLKRYAFGHIQLVRKRDRIRSKFSARIMMLVLRVIQILGYLLSSPLLT